MRYERDEKGRWLGQCLYCMKWGRANQLRRLPNDNLNREYCPRCYETPLAHHMKMEHLYDEMKRRENTS